MSGRAKVLFLCTGNSCRSQMAEGWTRALKPESIEPYSAGIVKRGVDPRAVRAMAEAGVDISKQYSKTIEELPLVEFDYVVTVCDHARGTCPVFPGAAVVVHRGFDDPPALAENARSEEEAMQHYRRVRDEIRTFVETLPESLTTRGVVGVDAANSKKEFRIREAVRKAYGVIAETGGSCCGGSALCGCAPADAVATAVGYAATDLSGLPDGANLGLSCGNPAAIASLRPGEVVLDLGAGTGFDVFIAARKVGHRGRVIGVDMTPEMVAKARENADAFRRKTGLGNVEFRLGEIEHLPVADNSVDVVISNCVINLSPDKPLVWREIFRVLKPGGRVAVSDIGLLHPLPDTIRHSVEALVGCIAGAVPVSQTETMVRDAGLEEISVHSNPEYFKHLTASDNPLARKVVSCLSAGSSLGDFVSSMTISARKPIVGRIGKEMLQ